MLAGDGSAEELLRTAAGEYGRRSAPFGEVYARVNLGRFLRSRDAEAARRELERADQAARSSGETLLVATVELERARLELVQGSDLEHVDRRLRRIEALGLSDVSPSLQRDTLQALGNVRYLRGRYAEAEAYYRRMAEACARAGDLYGEASARYGLVVAKMARRSGPRERNEVETSLRRALDAAIRAGQLYAETDARLRLGRLVGGEEGRRELERGLELARQLGDPHLVAAGLGALGAAVVEKDPAEARRRVDEALTLGLMSPHFGGRAYGWSDRVAVVWATSPREEALAESLAVLDLVERERDLQRAEGARAELFSVWTEIYHALAGRLFTIEPPDVETAFRIGERMRARVLLEALDATRALPEEALDEASREERAGVLKALVEVNRRLLDPALDDDERRAALAALERLERREAEVRDRAAAAAAAGRPPGRPGFAALAEVQAALAPDEALLSFQVAPSEDVYGGFAGGSWLLAVTREGARAYRLPDGDAIEPRVEVFAGRLAEGGDVPAAARRLHDELLGPALAELPPGVERLVVVPDGALYRLPFAALEGEDGALAERYRLTLVPSATLWLRWREAGANGAPSGRGVVFADPVPAAGVVEAGEGAVERSWALASGVHLAPLPHARREGRAALRHLATGSELLLGEGASERRAKALAPGAFGVVHFAAHAVIDPERPRRSAVVLAPGDPGEDGLLQPPEIAALDLSGALVVLSTCESAGGAVLRGEGPLSLARAFFAADARTVVASLWPLRDDQAAELFERFYRHLGRGATVAQALAAAQRDLATRGRPPSAWAAVAVYGDGDAVPLPGGRRGVRPAVVLAAAGLVAVTLLLVVRVFRRY